MSYIPKVHNLERAFAVTWSELVAQEPQLNDLLWQAREAGAHCSCWEDVPRLFAPFRGALAELVGCLSRHSRHSVLGSVGAYEVAYWRLYDAISGLLPPPASDPVRTTPDASIRARPHLQDSGGGGKR
jgi:hypothetical protein